MDIYTDVMNRLIKEERKVFPSEGTDIFTGEKVQPKCLSSFLKKWRINADLTQQEMADLLDCPKRNIENWEQGRSLPPEWSAKLVVEKLMRYIEEEYEENGRIKMDHIKSDRNKKRPVGSWAVISSSKTKNEFIWTYPTMIDAIDEIIDEEDYRELDVKIAYVICSETDDGPEPFFTDRSGVVHNEYQYFVLHTASNQDTSRNSYSRWQRIR